MLRSAGRDTCRRTPLSYLSLGRWAGWLSASLTRVATSNVGCRRWSCGRDGMSTVLFGKKKQRATICVSFGDGKQLKTMRPGARACVCERENITTVVVPTTRQRCMCSL
uniref:Uncharacterized protein n=1 Tax=Schizaphis graminum TaxID=13262 RepID=A0A2S2PN00_SCHGA